MYLVVKGTYANKAALDAISTKVTASVAAGTAGNLSTTGLTAGTYQVYAVDAADNVSVASSDITLTPAAVQAAVGQVPAVDATKTIVYTLTTGTFDATAGAVSGNWVINGTDGPNLGPITDVVLSNSNKTATITVSNAVVRGKYYTIAPTQTAMGAGFIVPAAHVVTVLETP